ncbi:MAG: tRNA cyclic N6-threonylcarbamoyladenosine(37) synthase TcdA, partial [Verrucomicrobiae bacterium]|nr:tRNA cyclic N6-threonylcarbamoyladenosine(37) synthase TcdA [Verrucomicrobiae bacterium]NNJ87369.1 tRNA cyclic N6-threonylcarbamoyladenosine(37) synthase TcdA [Akkermansiaceae bacterium]
RNADEILDQGFDYVIDAIDRVQSKSLLLNGCHQRNIPVISCGGAGGLRDPSQIRIDDISRCYNDSLMNQVRRNLRTKYGFPAGADPKLKRKARKFHIDCIFSSERPVYPQCDGEVTTEKPKNMGDDGTRLNCVSGYGSITHMTATFGFFAVSRCLENLAT